MITVEVVYARPEEQALITVELADDASLRDAIEASGIRERFPEIDLEAQAVGVFGQPKALDDGLRDGDRVAIYRPLIADPKEMRRRRAKGATRTR